MAMTVATNVSSLAAQGAISKSQNGLSTALQRLSSGMRINSAKDDAAGLGIATRMQSQVRGLNTAIRNANDGISLAQVAEGALGETSNILQRVRELAVQSSNASNSASDRDSLDTEAQQLIAEMDRIATQTEFNGSKILSTSGGFSASFQVGANAGETIAITVAAARSSDLGVSSNYTAVPAEHAAPVAVRLRVQQAGALSRPSPN